MDYVILDLEWNTAYSKSAHKFVNEIIEFGAVKVDGDFNVVAALWRRASKSASAAGSRS